MELIKTELTDMPYIYSQMEKNFIREEIRDFADAKAVFDNEKYTVYHVNEGGINVGFMCVWAICGITFLEHFVVYEPYRGKGYGGRAFDILKNSSKLLVLECEPPVTEVQKKRVDFYIRHGMVVNEQNYLQPPYRKGGEGCNLKLLSSTKLTEFEKTVSVIYKEVYGVSYE